MITIDTVPDITRITAALGNLGDQAPAAASRALNRLATTVRARAAREISKDMKVKVGTARGAMRITRANRATLESQVIARGARIPLIEFRARQTRPGTSYDIGKGRKTLQSAFIATMLSGHRGVFARQGPKVVMTKGRYRGQMRQRIYERFGPSIPRVFAQARVQTALRQVIAERWTTEITAQMNAVITRAIK